MQGEGTQSQARLRYAELLLRKGMRQEAHGELQLLVGTDSSCARGWYLLGVLAGESGSHREAAELLARAAALEPENAGTLNALGVALQRLGMPGEAAACYGEALRVEPGHLEARVNLALILQEGARLTEAERVLEEGVALHRDSPRLRYNLANVLQYQGRSLDALAAYREVLRLEPGHLDARQNLLFALHYPHGIDDRLIFAEHLRAARSAPFCPPETNRPSLPRQGRIRVGYLSPDFRGHSVASFIEPVLARHDRERFEIFCYSNVQRPDDTTERLRGLAEHWRDIHGVPDDEAALLIAADGIEILVDLAGHTSGGRLPLFARRPAPVQLTWIGYPDSTGLSAVDYRITDRLADPPGRERYHSEGLIRLPRSFCCYLPPKDAPPPSPPPCLEKGSVTFGSFNNLAKVTPETVALWSRVLRAVPGSGFLLKGRAFRDAGVRGRYLGMFEANGVDRKRVELAEATPTTAEHLAQYRLVDIALDTFPYNGTTTTCEALWMGVPVLTLAGARHASRTGASLLANCGLAQLVACDERAYLATAQRLAAERGGLADFRAAARGRLAASPLLDAAGVTRELEAELENLAVKVLSRSLPG